MEFRIWNPSNFDDFNEQIQFHGVKRIHAPDKAKEKNKNSAKSRKIRGTCMEAEIEKESTSGIWYSISVSRYVIGCQLRAKK